LIDSLGYWFVARRLKLDLVFTTIINVSLLNIMIDTNAIHSLGHSSQIVKQRCRINALLHFLACRTVNAWNSLPDTVVYCKSRTTFKRLDFFKFLSG